MVIKVDLQCCRCYKKIKKILCKFPQIRDQLYDEKNNTVTITVVCCSPEKIKQKICCKGGAIIKGIEIKPPPKPQPPPEKEKPAPKPQPPPEKEKPAPKPQPAPVVVEPPKLPAPKPIVPVGCLPLLPVIPFGVCCGECYGGRPGGPCFHGHGTYPIGTCCTECAEGRPGGPCFHGHGTPAPPPAHPIGTCCTECSEGRPGGPCFSGLGRPPPPCYGRPVYDSWGGGGVCRRDYFCEENPSACTIM